MVTTFSCSSAGFGGWSFALEFWDGMSYVLTIEGSSKVERKLGKTADAVAIAESEVKNVLPRSEIAPEQSRESIESHFWCEWAKLGSWHMYLYNGAAAEAYEDMPRSPRRGCLARGTGAHAEDRRVAAPIDEQSA